MSLNDFFIHILAYSMPVLVILLPASMILMTCLTPRSVIDQYVRPPHFSKFESVAYRYFPSSFIRTLLFTMAISVPWCRKIRGFGPINKNVPFWFNIASRIFVYGVLGYSYTWILVMMGLAVHIKFSQ